MPAAATTPATTIDSLPACLGSAIPTPPTAPREPLASFRLSVDGLPQNTQSFKLRPIVQQIAAVLLANRIRPNRRTSQTESYREFILVTTRGLSTGVALSGRVHSVRGRFREPIVAQSPAGTSRRPHPTRPANPALGEASLFIRTGLRTAQTSG